MLGIYFSFDFGKFPNTLPTHATPNHDAPSTALHSITNHTIAYVKPRPTPLSTIGPYNVEFTFI